MRRHTHALSSFAALALIFAPVRAEDVKAEIELVYKYQAGETTRLVSTTTGKGHTLVSAIPGQPGQTQKIPIDTTTEVTVSMKTDEVHPDGSADIDLTVESLTSETTAQNVQTTINVTNDGLAMTVNGQEQEAPDMLKKGMSKLVGTPFRMTMSKRGAVLDADWETFEGMEKLMGGMNMKQMMQASRPQFPDKPVNPGDSWPQVFEVKMAGAGGKGGALNANLEYTFLSMETVDDVECAKIEISGTMSMEDVKSTTPQMGVPANAQVNIDSMHIYMDGHLYFDPAAGRLVEQQLDMDMSVVTTIKGKAGDGANANAFEITTETEMKMATVTKVQIEADKDDAAAEEEDAARPAE